MEADLLHGSLEQPLSPYKSHNIKNPMNMKIHQPFTSRHHNTSLPTHISSNGLLKAPPFSLRPPPQPPLLPLPASHFHRTSSDLGPSCSPTKRNGSGTRHHAFIPKKSTKSPTKISKKQERKTPIRSSDAHVTVSSTSKSGAKNQEQPKNTAKVFRSDSICCMYSSDDSVVKVIDSSSSFKDVGYQDQEDVIPGFMVFAISPPPSSLPLPTFCLRPKLSCNAATAGVDNGATDNLRRFRRLQ